jgi:hypothetical protein
LGERNIYSELKKDFLHLPPVNISCRKAQMAELVDALDSKSGYRKVVQVRFLFWALENQLVMRVHESEPFTFYKKSQQSPNKRDISKNLFEGSPYFPN